MTSEEKKINHTLIAPQPILKDLPKKYWPREYDGDMEDTNAIKNYKLFQVWSAWADLFLILNKLDESSKDELKDLILLTIDRLGRILQVGNIGLELHT
jgi:hypothetical protein